LNGLLNGIVFYHKDDFWGKHNYGDILSERIQFLTLQGDTRFMCQTPLNTITPSNG